MQVLHCSFPSTTPQLLSLPLWFDAPGLCRVLITLSSFAVLHDKTRITQADYQMNNLWFQHANGTLLDTSSLWIHFIRLSSGVWLFYCSPKVLAGLSYSSYFWLRAKWSRERKHLRLQYHRMDQWTSRLHSAEPWRNHQALVNRGVNACGNAGVYLRRKCSLKVRKVMLTCFATVCSQWWCLLSNGSNTEYSPFFRKVKMSNSSMCRGVKWSIASLRNGSWSLT